MSSVLIEKLRPVSFKYSALRIIQVVPYRIDKRRRCQCRRGHMGRHLRCHHQNSVSHLPVMRERSQSQKHFQLRLTKSFASLKVTLCENTQKHSQHVTYTYTNTSCQIFPIYSQRNQKHNKNMD